MINGQGAYPGKHKVAEFHVRMNGDDMDLSSLEGSVRTASVKLGAENRLSVQLRGDPDSYVYVAVIYTQK